MKVLVLNGSPKGEGSNTLKLTNAFLDGAKWTNAETINAAKANVKPCLGCYACWEKTPGKCVISDDMTEILNKLMNADIIIWSFPLYYFSVPGALKNIIDRQLPMNMPFMLTESESGAHPSRYDLSHQRHIVISTCGFWTIDSNYDGVRSMFDHFLGEGCYTKIFCGQGELFRVPELAGKTGAYLELVRQAGSEYTSGGISGETLAGLSTPLYTREVFEKMADASWNVAADDGIIQDDGLSFTKQMSALYTPDGNERVIEFFYTDVNKTYQMVLSPNGEEVITNNFKKYTTRIETPLTVWRAIARGEISGPEAMFAHQYKVIGDFEVMLKWDDLFSGKVSSTAAKPMKKAHKTNMAALLVPWIIIWSLVSIDAKLGGIAGICIAAIVPLMWLKYRPVVYERVSIPLVTLISLCALLGFNPNTILLMSYALFGLLWLVSSFFKTPLTAYYSKENYGGDSALKNPLFMYTNRVLTIAWGVLYMLTPIWTYFIMGTGFAAFSGLINSLVPAIMGAFTAWYQKWLPAHWAGKGFARSL